MKWTVSRLAEREQRNNEKPTILELILTGISSLSLQVYRYTKREEREEWRRHKNEKEVKGE
jgi:TPP-dependent pyruvate/acetoin dehydrogenase alpha subunit